MIEVQDTYRIPSRQVDTFRAVVSPDTPRIIEGIKKTLDVLLRAGVVTNLVYSEVPMDQPAR